MHAYHLRIHALLALATIPATAAPPPVEVFYQPPAILEAVLSPAGRQLAFTSAAGIGHVKLVVMDLTASGRPVRVSQFANTGIAGVQWVSEERLVFGTPDSMNGDRRSWNPPGLYAVDADGKAMTPLLRSHFGSSSIGPYESPTLTYNHRFHRVPSPREGAPGEEILVVEHATSEPYFERLVWLNTRNGRPRDVQVDAPAHTVGWFTDSRGEPRVALTRYRDRRAAYWRAPGAKTWERLYESGLLDAPFTVNAVDDEGGLYVTHRQGPEGQDVLARYDFEAKSPAAQPMVNTPGFDFSGQLLFNGEQAGPLGVRLVVDGETTVWFDPALKALQAEVDRRFPGRINRVDCRPCAGASTVALVRSFSDHDPGQLWVFRAQVAEGERQWQFIGPVQIGVDPKAMASVDLHRIRARDGRDLPLWVTRPDTANIPLPAVVLVHGGPWVRGMSWHWERDAQFLASRGYVVIEPEMRGSAGYGDAHYRAGFRQFGQAMQDDVADALRWAQTQGLASNRACIAGASYGGYSTLMGLIRDPGLYRCGVAWMALADLDLYLSGSWWVDDDIGSTSRKYTLREMVGDADKDAAMIAAHSPVRQAALIKAPLLLAFGEADLRVPLAHGERLRKALIEAGNEPEWVSYPGEGHGFSSMKNRVDFALRMEAFLARHLKSNTSR
jgi:dipeptidyl aminopeptidase/acylaminoacyl peptidase